MDIEEYRETYQFIVVDKTLSYSGQDCKKIPPSLNKMFGDKIECLDLSYNCLVSLNGLNGFPALQDLILDNNRLTEIRPLPYMRNLATLSLNNNLITNLDATLMRIAEQLPNLTYLSLLGNPVCPDQLSDTKTDEADYQRYRYYVLHHLPNLKFLDFRRVTSEERKEANRRGEFLRVRRPSTNSYQQTIAPALETLPYTSLPTISSSRPQHKGAYGKCTHKYSGKHSEGNRFICNNDL
ncbi:leucine-rich melanocyte differentiation-associated protein-like isoform X2 [Arctopsyche grandis]|uniref:leucine-rich melanocyte differentiation-associated protein-like isoform X2 n=1 Tax=Arctopsyche grandis TaxID=121162 RepID=UPI00406D95F4